LVELRKLPLLAFRHERSVQHLVLKIMALSTQNQHNNCQLQKFDFTTAHTNCLERRAHSCITAHTKYKSQILLGRLVEEHGQIVTLSNYETSSSFLFTDLFMIS